MSCCGGASPVGGGQSSAGVQGLRLGAGSGNPVQVANTGGDSNVPPELANFARFLQQSGTQIS